MILSAALEKNNRISSFWRKSKDERDYVETIKELNSQIDSGEWKSCTGDIRQTLKNLNIISKLKAKTGKEGKHRVDEEISRAEREYSKTQKSYNELNQDASYSLDRTLITKNLVKCGINLNKQTYYPPGNLRTLNKEIKKINFVEF